MLPTPFHDASSTLFRHGHPVRMWHTMIIILDSMSEVGLACKLKVELAIIMISNIKQMSERCKMVVLVY
jgi:hypothetical protein